MKKVFRILFTLFVAIIYSSCSKEELQSYNCSCLTLNKGMKISILGDSYSTFQNFLYPASNPTYYPNKKAEVTDVTQTWWSLFITKNQLRLEHNNSYSGSTITRKNNTQSSYVERYTELGNPDIIFVFGGTNDSWQRIPLGNFQYNNWNNDDLQNFRPAFAHLLYQIQQTYFNTKIINIINTDLKKEYKESMEIICQHYNICNISLGDFEKKDGHPSKKGMESIYQQITKALIIK